MGGHRVARPAHRRRLGSLVWTPGERGWQLPLTLAIGDVLEFGITSHDPSGRPIEAHTRRWYGWLDHATDFALIVHGPYPHPRPAAAAARPRHRRAPPRPTRPAHSKRSSTRSASNSSPDDDRPGRPPDRAAVAGGLAGCALAVAGRPAWAALVILAGVGVGVIPADLRERRIPTLLVAIGTIADRRSPPSITSAARRVVVAARPRRRRRRHRRRRLPRSCTSSTAGPRLRRRPPRRPHRRAHRPTAPPASPPLAVAAALAAVAASRRHGRHALEVGAVRARTSSAPPSSRCSSRSGDDRMGAADRRPRARRRVRDRPRRRRRAACSQRASRRGPALGSPSPSLAAGSTAGSTSGSRRRPARPGPTARRGVGQPTPPGCRPPGSTGRAPPSPRWSSPPSSSGSWSRVASPRRRRAAAAGSGRTPRPAKPRPPTSAPSPSTTSSHPPGGCCSAAWPAAASCSPPRTAPATR